MEKSCTSNGGKKSETPFVFIHYCTLRRRSCSCHRLDICSSAFQVMLKVFSTEGSVVSVSLQMASNLSDLLLSDQLSCQETCKSFTATSPWLKAVILLVEKNCRLSPASALKEECPLLSIEI